MQIIAGALRGRKIKTLTGELTRPTTGMVRGAMFNILGPRIHGARVLDLYAGSGAIALEALSRGAGEVVLVEKASEALMVIAENLKALGMGDRAQVQRAEVMSKLPALVGPFDVVIADPPYRTEDWTALLTALQRPGLLAPDAAILLEHAKGEQLPEEVGAAVCRRTYRYGLAQLALFGLTAPQ
ncbi:MAG TPA: 16S rRNA (guanine(966)-N(2))-methyltransferase RsmD [Pantanalinema sp.]